MLFRICWVVLYLCVCFFFSLCFVFFHQPFDFSFVSSFGRSFLYCYYNVAFNYSRYCTTSTALLFFFSLLKLSASLMYLLLLTIQSNKMVRKKLSEAPNVVVQQPIDRSIFSGFPILSVSLVPKHTQSTCFTYSLFLLSCSAFSTTRRRSNLMRRVLKSVRYVVIYISLNFPFTLLFLYVCM